MTDVRIRPSDQGVAGENRYKLVPRTLSFVYFGNAVLLLKGAPSKRLWANQYNGIGGHVEQGEDIVAAARREILEETGLTVVDLALRGLVTIDVEPTTGVCLFLFSARATDPHYRQSAEGELAWFPLDDLPMRQMIEDLPALLDRVHRAVPLGTVGSEPDPQQPVLAHYSFDSDGNLVVRFLA